jgi:GH35 family endo-1,4-beta-xylanase
LGQKFTSGSQREFWMILRVFNMKIRSAACAAILYGAICGPACLAQTSVTGSNLALKSLNSATLSGSSYDSSYVGTYLTVPAGGATVDFDVNATEDSGGTTPHLNVSIADSNFGFNVSSTSATNYDISNVTLAAGTYFVSLQRDYANNSSATAPFTVNDLSVNTVSGTAGSTFTNTSSDANALAAANTYITNYRQGTATVHLSGPNGVPLLAGTPVNAKLGNIAFNFGDAVPGTSDSGVASYLGNTNGTYTSLQSNFQSQLNLNFNTVVLENDGKWSSNSSSQSNVDMTGVNTFLNYAQSHQMVARMHNLIWGPTSSGSQQPSWVQSLVSGAVAGNATNLSQLQTAISNRIAYYASSGNFAQIDVYNESYHTGQATNDAGTDTYWTALGGASGVANVYNQVAAAIAKSGSKAVTFTNEYNVFQNSNDNYANWYVSNIDAIRDAGGNVGEIGIEYYPSASAGIGTGDSQHSAARIESVLQGLAAQGLPAQVDEFGVAGTIGQNTATVDQILSDTMTLMFGDPTATGFVMWGDENASSGDLYEPAAAFYNVSGNTWTLTAAGQTYQQLLGINGTSGGWNTNVNLTTDANGNISFNGYYGQYYLAGEPLGSLNQKFLPFDLNMQKGTSSYNTTLMKPPNWFFWQLNTSGAWGTGSDWTDSTQGGGTPTTAGYTAYFGSSATNYNLTTGAATTVNITTPTINVTIGSAVTLGMIVFDNATTSYTLSGSAISLQGYNNSSGNVAAIYVNSGSHTITAPLQMLNNTTVTVTAANSTLTLSNLQTTTAILTKAGAGTLDVNAINAAGLAINAGTIRIISNGTPAGVSIVSALSVAANSTLDLTNNSISVNYTGASPLATLSADVAAAYDSGKWDMPGITSSTASNSLDYAVGIFDTGSQVQIAYTLVGDANLDGWVNASDLAMIQPGGTTWSQGDFNYDGQVNADDYALFMLGADESAALGRPVPEPAEMLVGLCLMAGLGRRRSWR